MSTGRSCRKQVSIDPRTIACAVAFIACATCVTAQARQSDSTQPINVNADYQMGSQDKAITILKGNVQIDQGTMHLDGDKAVGNFDQDNKLSHAVLTGKPAHMRQQMDDGSLVHGQADTIDYTVSNNTIVLTGDAVVVHEGQGETHAAKITYNTDTGQMSSERGAGGQVHMILQPQKKAAPAKKPATASSPATAPAQPASVAPAKPASAAPALDLSLHPASASSTH